jgi:hypothetical protein
MAECAVIAVNPAALNAQAQPNFNARSVARGAVLGATFVISIGFDDLPLASIGTRTVPGPAAFA